jgi:hypothetical protein
MTEPVKPVNPQPVPVIKEPVPVPTKQTIAITPDPNYNPVRSNPADVAKYENHPSPIDPDKVRPGPGPLEGSPNPSDPTKLANPNNPNSPVTGSANPSNPANPPATQSDKPISETRVLNEVTPQVAAQKAEERNKESKAEREATLKSIQDALNKFGSESSIPASHEYWALLNKYRVLNNP